MHKLCPLLLIWPLHDLVFLVKPAEELHDIDAPALGRMHLALDLNRIANDHDPETANDTSPLLSDIEFNKEPCPDGQIRLEEV